MSDGGSPGPDAESPGSDGEVADGVIQVADVVLSGRQVPLSECGVDVSPREAFCVRMEIANHGAGSVVVGSDFEIYLQGIGPKGRVTELGRELGSLAYDRQRPGRKRPGVRHRIPPNGSVAETRVYYRDDLAVVKPPYFQSYRQKRKPIEVRVCGGPMASAAPSGLEPGDAVATSACAPPIAIDGR